MFFLAACSEQKQKDMVYFNDFESIKGWAPFNLNNKIVHSGNFSNKLDTAHIYGATFKLPFKEIADHKIVKVKVSFWAFMTTTSEGKLVMDIKDKNNNLVLWTGKGINELIPKHNEWLKVETEFTFTNDSLTKPDYIISIYPWSLGKGDFYIDDFNLEFIPKK